MVLLRARNPSEIPSRWREGKDGERGQYSRTKSHVGCLQLNNAVERHGCYKQDIFNMAAQGRAKKQTGLSDVSLTALGHGTGETGCGENQGKHRFCPISCSFYVEARGNIYKVVFLRKAPVWEHLTCSEQELVLKPSSMCWVNKPTPSKNTQIP